VVPLNAKSEAGVQTSLPLATDAVPTVGWVTMAKVKFSVDPAITLGSLTVGVIGVLAVSDCVVIAVDVLVGAMLA